MAKTVKAPAGIRIPEDIEPGDKFESMVTFILRDGGMLELCEIQGEPVGDKKNMMTTAERYEHEMKGT